MNAIDLDRLPAPKVIEQLDFEVLLAALIAKAIARYPEFADVIGLESEPARKLLEIAAYRDMLHRERINDAARALLLAYAMGSDLDHLGARVDVERLPGEKDERFKPRVKAGNSLLAAAGPGNAYRAHVMRVSTDIVDVNVDSPIDGQVAVAVLARERVPVSEATELEIRHGRAAFRDQPEDENLVDIIARSGSRVMNAVRRALNAEEVRPLTDWLVVAPPTVVEYQTHATLTLYPGTEPDLVVVEARRRWAAHRDSTRKIGYDVTHAGITGALAVPGVQNVLLPVPAVDIEIGPLQLALCTAEQILPGGTRV